MRMTYFSLGIHSAPVGSDEADSGQKVDQKTNSVHSMSKDTDFTQRVQKMAMCRAYWKQNFQRLQCGAYFVFILNCIGQSHFKTHILETGVWQKRTSRDRKSNVFVFEVWKGTHWWWHSSPEWDKRDLLTQHLSALPSPIQTSKPSSTHCEWPAYHSTFSLLFLPTSRYTYLLPWLVPCPLSGVNVNKLTGAEASKDTCVPFLYRPAQQKAQHCPWCVCVCFFIIPYSRNDNKALPRHSHVFGGNRHNGVFSLFVCIDMRWYVTYCTLD